MTVTDLSVSHLSPYRVQRPNIVGTHPERRQRFQIGLRNDFLNVGTPILDAVRQYQIRIFELVT